MLLVLGATGIVGSEVLDQVLTLGEQVRVMVRDASRLRARPGVDVVVGDLGRPETLPAALDGVDAVFLLTGGGPETPLHDANLAQAAADAGARHLVKLSIIGANYGFTDLVSSWHLAGERTLEQIGRRPGAPTWTFIRPGEFSSNARLWAAPVRAQGIVYWAQTEPEVAVIHPRDVAAVAVKALTEPGHEGRAYRISGPEALSVPERVERLGKLLGTDVKLVDLPVPAVVEAARKAGRQPLVVETTLGNLAREEFRQQARIVTPTVEELLGRAPLRFEEWIEENLDIFRPENRE